MCQAGYQVEYSLRLQDQDSRTAMCSDCTKDFLNMAFRQQFSEHSTSLLYIVLSGPLSSKPLSSKREMFRGAAISFNSKLELLLASKQASMVASLNSVST